MSSLLSNPVPVDQIPVVTVSYNVPFLIKNLLSSFRRFYTNPYYIIDGSEPGRLAQIKSIASAFDNVSIISLGYNIHHGPGMTWAIANLPLNGPVLFLDSDVSIINTGFIESMMADFNSELYGVGNVQYINALGYDTHYDEAAIPYLHPACMICNTEVMKKWPPPIKHGAPMIQAMQALKDSGQSHLIKSVDWIKNDFTRGTKKVFIEHDFEGTVKATGGYHL